MKQTPRVTIEDILKKNDHVWEAYSSGNFSVNEYFEDGNRKIVLKENCSPGAQFNITKYRVRIRRSGRNEDHILLVSFSDAQDRLLNGAEYTPAALPAPALISKSTGTIEQQEAAVFDSAHYTTQSQSVALDQTSPLMTSPTQITTLREENTTTNQQANSGGAVSLNAIADDYYDKLSGPGTDLINRLVEGTYNRSQSRSPSVSSNTLKEESHAVMHQVEQVTMESEGEVNELTDMTDDNTSGYVVERSQQPVMVSQQMLQQQQQHQQQQQQQHQQYQLQQQVPTWVFGLFLIRICVGP